MTFPRKHLCAISQAATGNVRFVRIPRASPGMMCACRRRMLADKDFDQHLSASSRPVQPVLDRRLPRADSDRQCDAEWQARSV